jgi:prepilin-type N-terminal cleavage/methylation domain-containing protein
LQRRCLVAVTQQRDDRGRSRRRAGFTLIELMVVLVVIAVVAGLAAPTITKAMHERRAASAALDMVRIARHARAAAAGYGRAHLLRFQGGDPGLVQVFRGLNNRCNANQWANIIGGGCGQGNPMCVDELDLRRYATVSNTVQLTSANANIEICYEPTGGMRYRFGGGEAFLEANGIGGGFRFQVIPQDSSGGTNGVIRWVVIPLGGDARIAR